jgi:hypothetical protein
MASTTWRRHSTYFPQSWKCTLSRQKWFGHPAVIKLDPGSLYHNYKCGCHGIHRGLCPPGRLGQESFSERKLQVAGNPHTVTCLFPSHSWACSILSVPTNLNQLLIECRMGIIEGVLRDSAPHLLRRPLLQCLVFCHALGSVPTCNLFSFFFLGSTGV